MEEQRQKHNPEANLKHWDKGCKGDELFIKWMEHQPFTVERSTPEEDVQHIDFWVTPLYEGKQMTVDVKLQKNFTIELTKSHFPGWIFSEKTSNIVHFIEPVAEGEPYKVYSYNTADMRKWLGSHRKLISNYGRDMGNGTYIFTFKPATLMEMEFINQYDFRPDEE